MGDVRFVHNLSFLFIVLHNFTLAYPKNLERNSEGDNPVFLRKTRSIQLYNSLPGLILVHVIYGLPICTLMFRNFYISVPNEVLEAAKIDGTGFFGIYRTIMVPLSLTGFVVVGIWQFTNIWNEFLFAVTLTTQNQQPIMVALQNLSGSQIVHWNVQMAGVLLAALPTLIVYIFF